VVLAIAAISFVWFGMVLAISFLEAPLKFRAPGITLPLGLGIGRIVFRALNTVEALLGAATLLLAVLAGGWQGGYGYLLVAALMLVTQLGVILPKLHKRSDAVLAGDVSEQRSQVHWVYVGADAIKVIALLLAGISLLT